MTELICILAGLLICIVTGFVNPVQYFHSFLYAYIIWLGMTLGAMAQLMIHHLSGGRWGFIVRRLLEAALTPMPALTILFIPVYLGVGPIHSGKDWFQPWWVIVRAIVYFGIWNYGAWRLRALSLEQDRVEDVTPTRKLRLLSGPGLCILVLSVSFAVIDWIMVLDPGWTSTMFPGIFLASIGLMALAGGTAGAAVLLPRDRRFNQLAITSGWHDIGKLLFAFVLFWAYVAFSQLIIIWSGNLPREATWYLHRTQNGWKWLARFVAILCFAAPEAVLLFQAPKKNPLSLGVVATAVWFSQLIYLFWAIMPSFYASIGMHWMDVVVPVGVGLIWIGITLRGFLVAAPIPRFDPRLRELKVAAV